MNWSIDFAPMLPAPFFWAAGALAVVLVGYLLYRSTRGALLRAAAIAALLAALANPTLREEHARASPTSPSSSSMKARARRSATARRRPPPSKPTSKPNSARSRISLSNGCQPRAAGDMTSPGTQPFRRPQQGAGQHAARPPRRRHPADRRRGTRRAQVSRRAWFRRASARAAHRRPRRVRPPHRGPFGAALRHRRPVARASRSPCAKPARPAARRADHA